MKTKSGGGSNPLNNKGFTLIELLAVIAILAIVLIIAIPVVLNVIERARIGAFRDSVISVIKAGESYIALEEKSFNEIDIFNVSLDFSNKEQFKEGTLIYEDQRILAENIMNDRYCANGIKSNLIITKGDCYAVSLEVLEVTHNQIKVKARTTFDAKEIEGYEYSRDNGVTWSAEQNTDTYTFTGVEASKYHNVIVKVITKGNVGNLSRVKEVFTPLPPMIEIAGGPDIVAFMGISVDNEVYTWGNNQEIPTKVEGMPKAKAIAVGAHHNMAISIEGDLYTWGVNGYGRLGNGNQNPSSTPIKITSIGKVKLISAGAHHSMAVTESGELYTWGYNEYGQLGIGVTDTNAHPTPVKITSVGSVKDIKAGGLYSFALTTGGTLYGFGFSWSGELGLPGNIYPTPTQVPLSGIGTVKSISTGSQMSGIINSNGEVFFTGSDNTNVIFTFTKVDGISNAKQMIQGSKHTTVLLENGEIWSWGYNNYGQLGTGNMTNSDVPVKSHTISNIKILAGNNYTIAVLTTDNSVYTWGDNSNNQLGNGVYNFVKEPVKINIPSIDKISAKNATILAKTTSNDFYSWGNNSYGQLGNGDIITQRMPVKITSVGKIKDVVTSNTGENSAIIKDDNTVYTFGIDFAGALGQGTMANVPHPTPGKVSLITSAKKVFYNASGGYAINSDDYLYSWGWTGYGKLGQGVMADSLSPARISTIGTVKTVGATGVSAIALDSNNDLWHMGTNVNGEAGNGTFDGDNHPTPSKINTQLKFKEVIGNGSGAYMTITTAGDVYVWGENILGTDLCRGDVKCFKTLTKVNGLSNIKSVATNGFLYGAITEDGVLYMWGSGFYGDNDNSKTITNPTKINHITNVKQVEITMSNTVLIVKEDGSLYAWGHNGHGQLGNGFTVFSTNPIQIVK